MVEGKTKENLTTEKDFDKERADYISSPGSLYGEPAGFVLVCPVLECTRMAFVLDIDESIECPDHKKKMMPQSRKL